MTINRCVRAMDYNTSQLPVQITSFKKVEPIVDKGRLFIML
jgi:hypothetical protein